MSHTTDAFPHGNDGVVIPRLWVTIVLSMLVHTLALWSFPERPVRQPDTGDIIRMPLSLRLMPPEPPAPAVIPAPPRPATESALRLPRPQAMPRPQPAPPLITLDQPAAAAPPAVEVRPAPPRADDDFAAFVEARRRQRGASEPSSPVDAEEARRQRIIAGNLATQHNRTFGYDPNQGGGVFQVERLAYDHAEFIFYGWNRDIRRNTKQLIEVRKGEHADIRIAVVRRMVAIIREYEEEDFLWVSQRLGRSVMLSARPRDRAGLEDFMMREFFSEPAPAQR